MLVGLLCDKRYPLLRRYRHRLSARHTDPGLAQLEHRQTLNAVLPGDGELAELLMRRHLARSRRHLLAQLLIQQYVQQDVQQDVQLHAPLHVQQQEKQP
ncbi:FCD domain-containing protein [Oceanisphaera arctica]